MNEGTRGISEDDLLHELALYVKSITIYLPCAAAREGEGPPAPPGKGDAEGENASPGLARIVWANRPKTQDVVL